LSYLAKFAVVVLGASTLTACGESAEAREVREKSREALEATEDLVVETREDLKRKVEPRLENVQSRFEELESEIDRRGDEARIKLDELVRQIDGEIARVSAMFDDARNASSESAEDAWQHIERGLEQASSKPARRSTGPGAS